MDVFVAVYQTIYLDNNLEYSAVLKAVTTTCGVVLNMCSCCLIRQWTGLGQDVSNLCGTCSMVRVLLQYNGTTTQGLENSYYRYRLPNTDGILPSEYRDFEIPWYPVTDMKAVTVIPYRLHPVYLPVTGTPWLLFTE